MKIFFRKIGRMLLNLINKYYEVRYYRNPCVNNDTTEAKAYNRKILDQIDSWIDDDVYNNSIFHYGIQSHFREKIDRKINNDVTYSDILCSLQRKIRGNINYLELGVSVGKNFYQVMNCINNGNLTGFEIEDINPILERRLSKIGVDEKWDTLSTSIRKKSSSISTYTYTNNQIKYLTGDIFDENSWKKLEGQKFNLIFSDAFHSYKALKWEYEMLKKYDLIDKNEFVMLWDDLGGRMSLQFYRIARDIVTRFGLPSTAVSVFRCNGWCGQHEDKHLIGMVNNLLR